MAIDRSAGEIRSFAEHLKRSSGGSSSFHIKSTLHHSTQTEVSSLTGSVSAEGATGAIATCRFEKTDSLQSVEIALNSPRRLAVYGR